MVVVKVSFSSILEHERQDQEPEYISVKTGFGCGSATLQKVLFYEVHASEISGRIFHLNFQKNKNYGTVLPL
jgi:hypothetical protein